jgi:SAM-dependent methyltransferase
VERKSPKGAGSGFQDTAARWRSGAYVAAYEGDDLAPVERLILERYRDELSGRVLDLGCGAGRLTAHLLQIADETHGFDIAPAMIAACRRRFTDGTYTVGDMRDLSVYDDTPFDAVIAAYNVLDAVDPASRERTLEEVHRVLHPRGLFVLSAHNRHFLPRVRGPARVAARRPKDLVANIAFLPRRLRNHRRLRHLQHVEDDYALVNDNAHDFALMHYYVTAQAQVRQLVAHGFTAVEVLDLDCRTLGPDDTAEQHVFLYYVARRDER